MNPSQLTDLPADAPVGKPSKPINRCMNMEASLPIFARFLAVSMGIGPIVLLGIALSLRPNEAGLGTHQQLGLPPCSMRVILGIRCPACGMTTSWSHFARGQWLQSLHANPGGFLLAAYCFPFAACCFGTAKRGSLPRIRIQNAMIIGLLAIAIVSVVQWLARLNILQFAGYE